MKFKHNHGILFSAPESKHYKDPDEWRNNSRKNEETEPKQKQCPVVDVLVREVKSDALKNNIA